MMENKRCMWSLTRKTVRGKRGSLQKKRVGIPDIPENTDPERVTILEAQLWNRENFHLKKSNLSL